MFLLGRFPQVGPALEWAEKQLDPTPARGRSDLARLVPGCDHLHLSGAPYGAIQRTISDQLVMTKP
eukprot:5448811-Alexandrium_andersonii.AAC.1